MSGGRYRFGVLGSLTAERDGEVIALSGGRQRALLALLLEARGVPLTRDRLIDELWGERPPATAVSSLHVHLSKLRTLVGDLLLLEPGGYALASDRFVLDATELTSLLLASRADPAEARALLSRAIELFRGDPLCDVPTDGALGRWRQELEDIRLAVMIARIDVESASGTVAALIPELETLVTKYPFDERLLEALMLAMYRCDRPADAVAAFQRARVSFSSELGLDLSESVLRLQQRILEEDPTLLVSAVAPPKPTPAPFPPSPGRRSGVPVGPTRLVGREGELELLGRVLADPDVRILTLTGPGGVGKTRLVLELAGQQESAYADRALFVRLEQITDPELISAEIATALARRDGISGISPEGVVTYLHERQLLLVLDNFEQLIDAASFVAELALEAPQLRVLLTSRAPLHIRGEHVFDLEPLPLPTGERDVFANPAVSLFLQCALAADRRLVIDDELTGWIARICRALDGLPLAIELAASRLHLESAAQIASQLERPLRVGEGGLRDLPTRHQTLQNTIRWSYDLLSPQEQRTFSSAAVFRGGFTREALAAAVGRECGRDLESLLDASLVRRVARGSRFVLLELVRAFALEELEVGGELDRTRAQHRRYFAELYRAVGEGFDGDETTGARAELQAEHANLRAGLEDALATGDQASAVSLGLTLRALWFTNRLRHEGYDLTDRLLTRFSIPETDELSLLRTASALEGHGDTSSYWTKRLAERAAVAGDQRSEVRALTNLFASAANRRDVTEITAMRPRLQELSVGELAPNSIFSLHHSLAAAAYAVGEFDVACVHIEVCKRAAESAQNPFLIAGTALDELFFGAARDGAIPPSGLTRALELVGPTETNLFTMYALWLVARYAAGIAPDIAARFITHAERILIEEELDLWPESALRDETLQILGISDLTPLLEGTPRFDRDDALAEAKRWLASSAPVRRSEPAARR